MSCAAVPDGASGRTATRAGSEAPPGAPVSGGRPIGPPGPEFELIARIAREEAGLVIPAEKAPMVFARIGKRLRLLGVGDLAGYCQLLTGPEGAAERIELVSVLTTNVTSFFREAHHFEYLRKEILPALGARLA